MKILKLAAGFAAGYVLGARAGREKFEQIAATARKVSENPTVVQTRQKVMSQLGADTGSGSTSTSTSTSTGTGAGFADSDTDNGTKSGTPATPAALASATRKSRAPKSEPVNAMAPAASSDPLA